MLKNTRDVYNNRLCGGWLNMRYHLASWALSCLQLKYFYSDIELVTDKLGKFLLIDQLKLPYTKVSVELNALDNYNHNLWALGKIYAYSMQDEPFIHVDSDIYIWERFDRSIEEASLVAQNVEQDFSFYQELVGNLITNGFYIPNSILNCRKTGMGSSAFNAGLMGGAAIEFFRSFCKIAFEFVDRNKDKLDSIELGLFNTIFEQQLFYCLSKEAGIKVNCYKSITTNEEMDNLFSNYDSFVDAPNNLKYFHMYGEFKQDIRICKEVELKLEKYHNEYFERICQLVIPKIDLDYPFLSKSAKLNFSA